tara:strand:+ start:398 stop:1672 length:1275 start_codon:yes stop_codon:yes gene_type:complete
MHIYQKIRTFRSFKEGGSIRAIMVRLLLFGGKGGVGKTTMAAATAVWLADSGLRTLLISSDPAHSTSDSLETKLGSEPTPVNEVPNLEGLELDPEKSIETLMPMLSGAIEGSGIGALLGNDINQEANSLSATDLMIPGMDEALGFETILRHVENPRHDVVVFDTAPTGHTLRFLGLPEILDGWTDRILRIMRLTGGIRMMLMGGSKEQEIRSEIERFQRRVRHVRRIMADDTVTTFSLVTIPERMAVSESIRASLALSEHNILVDRVIVNRCTPNLDHPFLKSRRDIEQGHLDELKDRFDDIGVHQIPLESTDIHGIDHLRRVGSHMLGPIEPFNSEDLELTIGDQMKYSIIRSEVRFEHDDNTEYKLHLPGANKEEMSLRGEDGVLLIGLNNKEKKLNIGREFDTNSVNAKLDDDILTVQVPK